MYLLIKWLYRIIGRVREHDRSLLPNTLNTDFGSGVCSMQFRCSSSFRCAVRVPTALRPCFDVRPTSCGQCGQQVVNVEVRICSVGPPLRLPMSNNANFDIDHCGPLRCHQAATATKCLAGRTVSTVSHKSHDPCFRVFLMEAGVITFVAHCTHPGQGVWVTLTPACSRPRWLYKESPCHRLRIILEDLYPRRRRLSRRARSV